MHLAATSNTLPDKLGEGRFAAEDFRREIHALSARFDTLRVDGPDYRHAGLAPAPPPHAGRRAGVGGRGRLRAASLDSFEDLTAKLAQLHPSKYGRLVDGVGTGASARRCSRWPTSRRRCAGWC